jgi:hypothetical protein
MEGPTPDADVLASEAESLPAATPPRAASHANCVPTSGAYQQDLDLDPLRSVENTIHGQQAGEQENAASPTSEGFEREEAALQKALVRPVHSLSHGLWSSHCVH